MEIKQFLAIFKRWLWLILLGTFFGALGGYIFSSRQTPIYQATTRFVVMRAASTGTDYYSYLDSQQLISTYTELLTTERLINKASEKLGFEVYVGQASATQVAETQFVNLTVRDENPENAAMIANALVDLLINENEELQAVRYITAEENLQNRINQVQNQISLLQTQINDISSSTVQEQLVQVEAQIQDLQSQVITLESNTSTYNEITATTEEKKQYEDDLFNLTQTKAILSLYQEIYTNLVVLGEPLESGNNSTSQLNQLQTTLTLYQQIYISSISSLENIRLMRAQNMPNVVQVEPAAAPRSPISPNPTRTALLAGLVGLIAAAGISFLVEYLDDTIKTPDDVKNILGLSVIGLVAEVKSKGSNKKAETEAIFVANQPRSPISESFRSLRTNLEFSSLDKPIHTILVTSSGAAEGKTTISVNLAVILAQGRKKVLLIDCDMRRPSVHKLFNIHNRVGLSDLIRGHLEQNEVIRVTDTNQKLFVITSGSLPPNPAEFLSSERFSIILNNLKPYFDMIILDTPPMVVADVQILSSKVDGILYVIRPGATHAGAARTALEDLKRIDARVLGVILNRIPRNRDSYYGGYRYYSPYTGDKTYNQNVMDMSQSSKEDKIVN